MKSLTIGQVAKAAGVGVETVRFYERQGLIEQPPRPREGYRRYPPETVAALRFIRRAKELGFTLPEIAELLGFCRHEAVDCATVRQQAETKIADIEERMAALGRMRDALGALVEACRERGHVGQCPLLETLVEESKEDGS